MAKLNDAFDQLKERVPKLPYEKKLSREEAVKLAIVYIQFMKDLLD